MITEKPISIMILHVLYNLEEARVELLKPEKNMAINKKPLYEPYEYLPLKKWSGGEREYGYGAIYIAILSYSRARISGQPNSPKVLMLDNPFGEMSSVHVVTPLFTLAMVNKTQLVCLTALQDPALYTYFPVVYSLNTQYQAKNKEYIRATVEKGGYSIAPLDEEREALRNQLKLFQ